MWRLSSTAASPSVEFVIFLPIHLHRRHKRGRVAVYLFSSCCDGRSSI